MLDINPTLSRLTVLCVFLPSSASSKDAAYLGKILEGFTLATTHKDNKTVGFLFYSVWYQSLGGESHVIMPVK